MAKLRKTSKTSTAAGEVEDYRFRSAKRKNNPPAAIAAAAQVPVIPKAKYEYNPHLPPVLRFDQTGRADILETRLSDAAAARVAELLGLTSARALSHAEREELATLIAQAAYARVAPEPWLEWTGKREKKWFEVDPVALHIHERISAQAILKVAARQDVQRSLFADPQQAYHEAVQFYRHDIDWANRLILGDSLSVMSSLAKREDLAGKVQMIYIDPPYGIKFASNFQPEIGKRDVKDKETDLTREPEMVKAYRDTWNLGIHSYLSYLRDRLVAARELLADGGSIFVQISDENAHRIRTLMEEVFGTHNHVSTIAYKTAIGMGGTLLDGVHDNIVWFARDIERIRYRQLKQPLTVGGEGATRYTQVESSITGEQRLMTDDEREDPSALAKEWRPFRDQGLTSRSGSATTAFSVEFQGRSLSPPAGGWRTATTGMTRVLLADRAIETGKNVSYKKFFADSTTLRLSNLWSDTGGGITSRSDPKVYVVQTTNRIIERCLLMTTDPGDLVFDPTCGSGTTAYVAEQWGRRWITCDTSRVALSIARQRLLTAKFDYYKTRGTRGQDAALTRRSGVPAASFPSGGAAARESDEEVASTFLFGGFDPEQPVGQAKGGNLPHWRQEGATYFVTWRTADSMPAERVRQWTAEREEWLRKADAASAPRSSGAKEEKAAGTPLLRVDAASSPRSGRGGEEKAAGTPLLRVWTDAQRMEYARLFTARWERWLDECHGECVLRRPEIKRIVEDSLRHFDGLRYSLGEFIVMPNHVHVLVTPLAGHDLSEVVGAWKSFTAHAIDKALGRKGEFWQKESFDHIVRTAEQVERLAQYIADNPRRSGVLAASDRGHEKSGEDAASTIGPRGEDAASTIGPRGGNAVSTIGQRGEDAASTDPNGNPAKGFIYKTIPHITLKSIAQNVALDPIFARHQPILDEKLRSANSALANVSGELRHKLEAKLLKKQKDEGRKAITDADRRRWLLPPDNRDRSPEAKKRATVDLESKGWYAWEVPFDTDPDWPKALQEAVGEYRKAWRAKMDEVNACIAASAESEELVDQPEVVRGVTRVSGPFTVEAVQPPEMSLSDLMDETIGFEGAPGEVGPTFGVTPVVSGVGQTPQDIAAYLDKMIKLLKLDGVRFPNNKQMTFSRLEAIYDSRQGQGMFHAEGRWVNAGDVDPDSDGDATVGVVIGPQYGPVSAKMLEGIIKPASRRYDDLVVAAFSFDAEAVAILTEDPHLKLRLHIAHIRPDVNPAMDGLLKDSPGGQLFTVFGLPRIGISPPDADGMFQVTMEGVDIYDPVNNTIQSSGADKVAAWFLDSDYDGRTFCVTQAFFPDRSAWDKLARALGGAIDADRFEALSGTTSLPFAAGKHKRVAVKVIDPRGNEVMTVQAIQN